ncbi:hypothetical protein [Sebaldella sp. S0638]|uniref:hypothetical protein n=1 Tax=Sebaldella sp. S0638 TaxID=2957809 RepID=UPI00209E2A57|nr:hypothetical protein [Sebaldella sp. S0638]MCP1225447.1 hypothetical protein [Sebaldella sp. S0638]
MKKGIFLLAFIIGVSAFSNCDVKAEKLLNTVIKEKLTISKNDNLKYYTPEMDGADYYKYQIFENHETHTVKRAYIELDMKTGTAYKMNIADDKLEKIYQDKKSVCK